MSNEDATPKRDLIEAAMSRIAATATSADAAADADAASQRSVGRREYDQALSRRLDQIRTALGTDDPPAPAQPAGAAAPVVHIRVAGVAALVLTALISALTGAAVTWLALGGSDSARPAATASLPASVQTAPARITVTTPLKPVAPALTPAPVAAPAATTAPVDAVQAQVRDLVERWRAAWAGRDVDSYLGFYSSAFVPADGSTRTAWAAARRKNISSRADISVTLNDMQITRIGAEQTQVAFRQDYVAGTFRETAKLKTLLLERVGDDWRIVGEWMGERP